MARRVRTYRVSRRGRIRMRVWLWKFRANNAADKLAALLFGGS